MDLVRSSRQHNSCFCSASYISRVVVWACLSGLQPGLKAESAQPVRMMSVSNWDGALLAEPRDWQLITDTLNSSAREERLLLRRARLSRSPPHPTICVPPLSAQDLCHLRDSSWHPSIRVQKPLRWRDVYQARMLKPRQCQKQTGHAYTPTFLKAIAALVRYYQMCQK